MDDQTDKRPRQQLEPHPVDGFRYLAKVAGSNPVVRSKKMQVRSPFHESLWTAGGRGKRPECTRRARRRLTGVPK